MKKFLIVIKKSKDGYGAYSPDLPGCVAGAETPRAVEEKMYEAINFHIDGLIEDGLPVPDGESSEEYMVLPVSAS